MFDFVRMARRAVLPKEDLSLLIERVFILQILSPVDFRIGNLFNPVNQLQMINDSYSKEHREYSYEIEAHTSTVLCKNAKFALL